MELIKEWDENTPITWWSESRIKSNKIIRKYNKWLLNNKNNKIKTIKLLNKIKKELEKDYCNQDGGSGYKNELILMKSNVTKILGNLI